MPADILANRETERNRCFPLNYPQIRNLLRLICLLLILMYGGGCKPAEMPAQELPAGPDAALIQACPWQYSLARTFTELPPAAVEISLNRNGSKLFVVGNRSLHVLNSDSGEIERQWELPGTGTAVSSNSDDQIFVAITNQILHFDTNGKLRKSWDSVRIDDKNRQFRMITGLAATATEVFVADAGLRRVFRFAIDGDFIGEIGAPDKIAGVPGLRLPSPHLSCVVVAENLLAVNNPGLRRIEYYDFNGNLKHFYGASGTGMKEFSGCCNPTNLAGTGASELTLATSEKGLPRIQVFSPDGDVLAYIGPEHFNKQSSGIALALSPDAGSIYALDPGSSRILVFKR